MRQQSELRRIRVQQCRMRASRKSKLTSVYVLLIHYHYHRRICQTSAAEGGKAKGQHRISSTERRV